MPKDAIIHHAVIKVSAAYTKTGNTAGQFLTPTAGIRLRQ